MKEEFFISYELFEYLPISWKPVRRIAVETINNDIRINEIHCQATP